MKKRKKKIESIKDMTLEEIAYILECSISTASRKRSGKVKLKGFEPLIISKYIEIANKCLELEEREDKNNYGKH